MKNRGAGNPRQTWLVASWLLSATMVLPGCAAHSIFAERSTVSKQIARHAGHSLRPDTGAEVRLPPGVDLYRPLNTEDAIAIALWNGPPFQETLAKLGLSRAELAQAGLLANPTLSVLFPLGPKQLEFTATFPLEALWLRPLRVGVARLDAERVANELVQGGLDLVRDVKLAVSDVALARDRVHTSREAAGVRDKISDITSARERAGEASELDVATQVAEAVRARDETARLEYDVVLAEARLLAIIGLTGVVEHVDLEKPTMPVGHLPAGQLEQRALAARPDLRAAEIGVEVAGERAGLALAEIFALSGLADANGSGKQGFEMGPGVALPLPILNQNQWGRQRADAEVERAAWGYVGTRQRVLLEVRTAQVRFQQASDAWNRWTRNLVPSLEDLVAGSERAYEIGDMEPLTLQENARQLIAARVRQAELASDVRRAWAELERSVGMRLPTEGRMDVHD